MSKEDEVRQASQRFYAALTAMANGDPGPMADVWSHSADVTTMHPIGGRETGWDEVDGPWHQVAGLASEGQISLANQHILATEDMAVEVGDEEGHFRLAGEEVSIDQRVTNVYRREAGGWKVVHHHTDLSPAMQDILSRLQGG